MASNYIDDLNALYSTRVFLKENVGLGPNAEDNVNGAPMRKCLKCDLSAEDCECEWSEKEAKSEDDMVIANSHDYPGDDFAETGEHPEHEASNMVKQNLYRIAKMAAMLYDIIPCDSEIEPWVADKLSKATENINGVLNYKDYEDFKRRVDQDIEIEEKTEQDLYKSIDAGGENLINKIKELMSLQPKEKVEDAVYGMIKMLEA
jgi:hypothetical protein